jgi:hypothetical protein
MTTKAIAITEWTIRVYAQIIAFVVIDYLRFIRVLSYPTGGLKMRLFCSPHCESLDDDSMMMCMSNSQGDSMMFCFRRSHTVMLSLWVCRVKWCACQSCKRTCVQAVQHNIAMCH